MSKSAKFDEAINLIMDFWAFELQEHGENVVEFWHANEMPVFRLLRDTENKHIIVSFSVQARATDSILIFMQLSNHFDNIALGDIYYFSKDKEMFYGDEAVISEYMDFEQSVRDSIMMEDDLQIDDPTHPVSFVSHDPIFVAGDPKALEYFDKLDDDKKKISH